MTRNLSEGALELSADTLEYGKALSEYGVLRPLWKATWGKFHADLIAQQKQSFQETQFFLKDCNVVAKLSCICSERFFVYLKSQHYVDFTKFHESSRPPVIWKYWLEPAELLTHVDIFFNALMINKTGHESKQDVILSGVLEIIIRTEFLLCMVQVEYYPAELEIRNNNTKTGPISEISWEDETDLRKKVWSEWVPHFVSEVTNVVATRDFCDKWLPKNYYSIIKY